MEDGSKPPQDDEDAGFIAIGMRYASLAFEFVGVLAVFGYVGYRADESWGWTPWGLFAGLLIGMGFGLFVLIRQLEKLDRTGRR